MANQTFQDRISRIEGAGPQRSGPVVSPSRQKRVRPNTGIIGVGGGVIGGGSYVLRKLNEHYIPIKAEHGLEGVIASAVFGAVLLIAGCAITYKGLVRESEDRAQALVDAAPKPKPGGLWTLFGTIHGLVFAFLGVLFVQASGYERFTGTPLDPTYVAGFGGLALLVGGASLLHPVLGLILRKPGFYKAFGFFFVGTLIMAAMARVQLIVPIRMVDVTPYIQAG